MAKGRTNQPLVIAVPMDWVEHPEMLALKAQGHTIVPQDWRSFDLILAPQAHKWDDTLFADVAAERKSMLPAALSMTRREKRERRNG